MKGQVHFLYFYVYSPRQILNNNISGYQNLRLLFLCYQFLGRRWNFASTELHWWPFQLALNPITFKCWTCKSFQMGLLFRPFFSNRSIHTLDNFVFKTVACLTYPGMDKPPTSVHLQNPSHSLTRGNLRSGWGFSKEKLAVDKIWPCSFLFCLGLLFQLHY